MTNLSSKVRDFDEAVSWIGVHLRVRHLDAPLREQGMRLRQVRKTGAEPSRARHRHKRELEEFDAAKKALQEGTMESEDTPGASAETGATAGGGAQQGQPGGGKKKNRKKKNSGGGQTAGGGGADDSMQD